MLKKQYVKSRNIWKVTFELGRDDEVPAGLEAETVHVVGEFNDWETDRTPMKRGKGGAFRATVELDPGQEMEFRYLVNGEHWCNDRDADAYVPGGMGPNNCVAVLPADPDALDQ